MGDHKAGLLDSLLKLPSGQKIVLCVFVTTLLATAFMGGQNFSKYKIEKVETEKAALLIENKSLKKMRIRSHNLASVELRNELLQILLPERVR